VFGTKFCPKAREGASNSSKNHLITPIYAFFFSKQAVNTSRQGLFLSLFPVLWSKVALLQSKYALFQSKVALLACIFWDNWSELAIPLVFYSLFRPFNWLFRPKE
jgi:hypothetical protein